MIKKIYEATSRFNHLVSVSYLQATDWEEERRLEGKCFRAWFSALKYCVSVNYEKKAQPSEKQPKPLETFSFYNQTFSFCFQIWFKTWNLLSEALDDLGINASLGKN